MILSNQWLQNFVPISIDPHEFAEGMSLSGSKVEGYTRQHDAIAKVVVGRIEAITPHPNADRLQVCQLDVGNGVTKTILTAATNVTPGKLVPVALDGALLPGGKEIHEGDMRGLLSQGMLCSFKELGLTLHDVPYADENGILLLEEPCAPGDDICDVLGMNDTVFEFEITPNRPDCLSVRGLAREVSATFGKPLTLPEPTVKGGGGQVTDHLKIQIADKALCPRYTARVVKDVKIAPSPSWLRARLRAAGVRPINNIVDVTNYVMLEYGQPMHAFDHACLEGEQIVVRTAREGEVLYTLDGQERNLTPNMLVISDAQKAVCVAGVMGGANSEITDKTTMIVLESATFNGPSVRKTALQLSMRTDASSRFAKGLDTQLTLPALERACELIEALKIGTVLNGVVDVNLTDYTPRQIPLESAKINALLGTDISKEKMETYLTALQFTVQDGMVSIPSYRGDVTGMADLAEEVARLYGYNNIDSTLSSGRGITGALTPRQQLVRKVKQTCRNAGFDEMLTYSFISPSDYDRMGLPKEHILRENVCLLNPLGEDKSVMRTTMLPSLLTMLAGNVAVRNSEALLYEIGLTFHPIEGEKLPSEETRIALGAYGAGYDFYALKGVIEMIAADFYLAQLTFIPRANHPTFHPGRCADVYAGHCYMGTMGELHPTVRTTYGFESRAWAAELSFDALLHHQGSQPKYTPLPRFPVIRRDIALLCDRNIPSDDLRRSITAACDDLLVSCNLFDVYEGDQIPAQQKSMAYTLIFRAAERTLTDAEVDTQMKSVVHALAHEYGAVLR